MPEWLATTDGAYIVNLRWQLAWPRCVEGMRWNGRSCTGVPRMVDHGEAMALARAKRKADGGLWRVPRAPELQKLARVGPVPGIEGDAFPDAPADWHWTSTANLATESVNPYTYDNIVRGRGTDKPYEPAFLQGWVVNPATGEARSDMPKRTRLPVRLVRELPPER
jgi:hypothetical protein